jgi:hypothetical protein
MFLVVVAKGSASKVGFLNVKGAKLVKFSKFIQNPKTKQ